MSARNEYTLPNGLTGVNVVLSAGGAIGLIMAEAEAERLMADFTHDKLPPMVGSHNYACRPGTAPWRARACNITAMHRFLPPPQEVVDRTLLEGRQGAFPSLAPPGAKRHSG